MISRRFGDFGRLVPQPRAPAGLRTASGTDCCQARKPGWGRNQRHPAPIGLAHASSFKPGDNMISPRVPPQPVAARRGHPSFSFFGFMPRAEMPAPDRAIDCGSAHRGRIHARGWLTLPWLVIAPPIRARSELGRYFCHPEVRGSVGFHVRTARTDPDLLAGLVWVQSSPFRPVMQTKMTGHFAPHAFTSRR